MGGQEGLKALTVGSVCCGGLLHSLEQAHIRATQDVDWFLLPTVKPLSVGRHCRTSAQHKHGLLRVGRQMPEWSGALVFSIAITLAIKMPSTCHSQRAASSSATKSHKSDSVSALTWGGCEMPLRTSPSISSLIKLAPGASKKRQCAGEGARGGHAQMLQTGAHHVLSHTLCLMLMTHELTFPCQEHILRTQKS